MDIGFTNDTDFQEGAIILINKPYGWTSFNVVSKVKYLIRKSKGYKKIKVGHAGTLDPLASGLMVVCVGKATKMVESFINDDKEYVATFHLGQTTPSYDMETQMNQEYPVDHINRVLLEEVVQKFIGEQDQVPPLYSAKFVDGKRAYKLARKGVEMELKPVKIIFHELEIIKFELPELTLRIKCSKGTYIRSLARDLGKALNSGAYLSNLVRVGSGKFKLADAKELDEIENFFKANVTN